VLFRSLLSLSIFSVFTRKSPDDFSLLEFWRHALGAAVCSEMLAKRLRIAKPEESFTCGLLHDIGKLVLNEIDPARLASIVQEASKNGTTFLDIERQRDLPGHCYLGEVIASRWGLPQSIRLVIHYHHTDVTQMDTIIASAKPLIQIVRLANALCIKSKIGHSGDCSNGELTQEMLTPLKLQMGVIPQLEAQLQDEMGKAGALLNAYR
jgi:putative nucleotidyltransferase with HDIG domain